MPSDTQRFAPLYAATMQLRISLGEEIWKLREQWIRLMTWGVSLVITLLTGLGITSILSSAGLSMLPRIGILLLCLALLGALALYTGAVRSDGKRLARVQYRTMGILQALDKHLGYMEVIPEEERYFALQSSVFPEEWFSGARYYSGIAQFADDMQTKQGLWLSVFRRATLFGGYLVLAIVAVISIVSVIFLM